MLTNLLVTMSLLSIAPLTWNSNVTANFHVVDDTGTVISNAVITTRTQRDRLANLGHAGPAQRKIDIITDTTGHASVKFPCYSGEFSSSVTADGFYPEEAKNISFKYASDSVYFAHLLEHHKDVSFTLRKKINPIPMYHNRSGWFLKFPGAKGRFGFDLKENDWVSPYGRGLVGDFDVEYSCSETNGVRRIAGTFIFPGSGDGAYKMKKEPFSYCSVYRADTNAVYSQRIDFIRVVTRTNFIEKVDVLGDDEYLVLRTRTKMDDTGRIVSANYSKIYGECICDTLFHFQESFFNPTPNDPNLEFDEKRNLAPRRKRRR